jgi:hypothetical protein
MLERMWGKKEPLLTVGGNANYLATMKISVEVPQKTKRTTV